MTKTLGKAEMFSDGRPNPDKDGNNLLSGVVAGPRVKIQTAV